MIRIDVKSQLISLLSYIEVEVSKDWSIDDFNRSLSVEKLAQRMNMSVRSLSLYFKQYSGTSLAKYIASRRAEYVARMFRLFPDVSTAEVSRISGFFNPPALYTFLKKRGIDKPSDLHKTHASGDPIPYRIEKLPDSIMLFKLHYGQYNDYNDIDFEIDNWNEIESVIEDVKPLAYVGMAIDNYLSDEENSGTFMAGILYDSKVSIPKQFGARFIPTGHYAVFTHVGPYAELLDFYNSVIASIWLYKELSPAFSAPLLEKYPNSPSDTSETNLVTELLVPLEHFHHC